MKDLDESPDAIDKEVVAPVKTETRKIHSRRIPRGMTQWEFNLETHVGKPVEITISEVSTDQNGVAQLRHHVNYRKDRYYCMAINLKNATKKYKKWLVANNNMKRIILASLQRPNPESPSAAASQSE